MPLGLAFGTGLVIPGAASSPHWLIGEAGLTIWCVSGLLFVLSFWAVGLVANTVRAVLAAIKMSKREIWEGRGQSRAAPSNRNGSMEW